LSRVAKVDPSSINRIKTGARHHTNDGEVTALGHLLETR
jgi:hypothetical protein